MSNKARVSLVGTVVVGLMLGVLAGAGAPLAQARGHRRSKFEKEATTYLGRKWDEATVTAPVSGEVCFSPVEPCDIKLEKFVSSAIASLDVAIFDITLDQLAHRLLVAGKKIPVRIVVDRRQAKGPHSLVPLLLKAGGNLRIGSQRGIMHNKFTIVDGKMIETGSFNYTNHATEANNENQLYSNDPKVVERYKERFEEIWREAKPAEAKLRGLSSAPE